VSARHCFASSRQPSPRGEYSGGGRNRIAVPTLGDKSRERSTEAPFMAIGRGGNSIAPVFPQYALTSVQKETLLANGIGKEREKDGKLGEESKNVNKRRFTFGLTASTRTSREVP